MASLSLQPKFSLHPNNSILHFHLQNKPQIIFFTRKVKIKTKKKCSSIDPQQQQQKQRESFTRKKKSVTETEKGVDPVGFLTKLGITHKAFISRYKHIIKQTQLGFWRFESFD
ncbi:hypothetical protein ERO13_D08G190050v2 [Gossypium hirsutum]|nr:hypothetical protein ERO13_D08G190050v2 [Gossypium hirsutum]